MVLVFVVPPKIGQFQPLGQQGWVVTELVNPATLARVEHASASFGSFGVRPTVAIRRVVDQTIPWDRERAAKNEGRGGSLVRNW
jgi:hypothetical protein